MPYPSGAIDGSYSENIRQIIPVPSQFRAKNYAVIAGFQLDDEQLIENRAFLAEQRRIAEEKQRIADAAALEEMRKNGETSLHSVGRGGFRAPSTAIPHYNQ